MTSSTNDEVTFLTSDSERAPLITYIGIIISWLFNTSPIHFWSIFCLQCIVTSSTNDDVTILTSDSKSSGSITYRHPTLDTNFYLLPKLAGGGPKFAKNALEPCLVHCSSVSKVRGRPIYAEVPSASVALANPPIWAFGYFPFVLQTWDRHHALFDPTNPNHTFFLNTPFAGCI